MAVPLPSNNTYGMTEQHCQLLNNVLESCQQTRELVGKLKRVGLDMSQADQQNERQHEMATGLKREFFPHLS